MKKYLFVCLILALAGTQVACKKDNDNIGLNSENATLQSASVDTFQLLTYSKESKNTPSNSGTSVFIGGYHSDELGSILAQSYTSVAPTDLSFRIPEGGVTVTSVSLSVRITSSYGEPFTQSFVVNKTASSITKDINYFTSDSLEIIGDDLGTFTINSNDTGIVSIELDKSYGEEIIATGDVIFTTSEMFIEVFKGLAIIPTSNLEANTGSIYGIDADEIILTINYTENISSKTGSVTFSPSTNSRSFYHTLLNFSGSNVETQFFNSALGSDHFYVQGLGSVKSDLKIPSILNWFKNGKYLVNKAIVTIPVSDSKNGNFTPPTSLTIHKASDSSSEGIQAVYDTDNNQYVFEIESLLSDKLVAGEEAEFELSVLNSYAHPEQVKLNGSENSIAKASIVIHYTEY